MTSSPEAKQKAGAAYGTDHYIVAIGASAGGLEAIQEFFDNMPSNGALSFVIIQHLSPDYKSLLVEILSKHTHMQVQEAAHDAAVAPNAVYVIPNTKLLTIKNGRLQLREKKTEKAPNTAIDTFLRSLAEDQGTKAIAVVLSGTGTDGSRGIESIQAAGGMVLVQDPVTAKFDGMPNSAIASGYADYILAPELMPEEIYNYINELPVRAASDGRPDEAGLPEVLKLVEKSCGHDFTNYKSPTLLRRIGRRMTQLGYRKFSEYLDFVRTNGEECKLLGKEFLIGVTKFFRDKTAFDLLGAQVLQELIDGKKDGDAIKVWAVACSTGEEAYSIGMLANELLQRSGRQLDVKIFATDLDAEAVDFAAKGLYPAQSVAEMDAALVKRYFVYQNGSVLVLPHLRKQIVFARHNVLKDPPFIKNDLVSCRNMLIYMNGILQRRVFSTLQFSLNTGGYLFLGPSEVPASIRDGLQELNAKWKIYRKTANGKAYAPERIPAPQAYRNNGESRQAVAKESGSAKDLAEDFKKLLTEEYGFAAVYVDKNFEVREAVGDYKKYLSLPDKVISLQLLKMVRSEVTVALTAALRKAAKEGARVVVNNIRLRSDDEKGVTVFVKPAAKEGLLMVAFAEAGDALLRTAAPYTPAPPSDSSGYLNELEEELRETRNNLQLAVESSETANEELQSSNEELLSANEELQSSNEELQSLNEELHTLNTEHQLRIKELIELNDDLDNYFRSTEIAQVFVDRHLRIRKFNPAAAQMINVIDTDIGRPIEHISTSLKDYNFYGDILTVSKGGAGVEKEIRFGGGRIGLMRILPYLRRDETVDGVVISFVDVTGLKEMDNIIKGIYNASLNVIMAVRAERTDNEITCFRFVSANHAADELIGQPIEEYRGRLIREVFPQLYDRRKLAELVAVVDTGTPLNAEGQLAYGQRNEWHAISITKMGEDGLVITLNNINEKKVAEEKFRRNYHELLNTKDSLRSLNAQLEEKVAERTFALSQSEERFRLIANAATDAIWDWDLVNNTTWRSEAFFNRFGFSKTDQNAGIAFWLSRLHPHDRDRVYANLLETINGADASWIQRYRLQKADGTWAILLDRGTVLTDEQGVPYRMVGSMLDITESEQSAQLLKQKNDELQVLYDEFKFVTDFMPQMVWSTNADGYHDFYNKGWYDYTGLGYEQTKGEGWNAVLHPDDQERAWKIWNRSLQTGEPYEIEYRIRRFDREFRWFLGRALPMKDENGKILKWFGTCTDIQEQKTASEILENKVQERTVELRKINADLEVSNTELLQFASVASHDLKEPLRKIHMFGNLISERFLKEADAGAKDYMNRIITASARMTRLINDLLSFTRLSVNSEFESTNLNSVMEEVLSDLEVAIEEKGAVIDVATLPQADVIAGQMRQVFQNLISNALKFSRKEVRPVITVRAEIVDSCAANAAANDGGGFCRITITDNGIGFNNAYREKIFTIFQRLHAREKYDGTGIGLAITKKIIERHHGIITAESVEEQGTTFILVLPLEQVETVA